METIIGNVPDDWSQTLLGEVCAILAGPSGSSVHHRTGGLSGVPMIMPRDVKGNHLLANSIAKVEPAIAAKLSRYRLSEGDIVCVRIGELARQALIDKEHEGWLFGSGCVRLRLNAAIDPRYLFYYLGHPAVREWIQRNATGSAIPSLSAKTLRGLPVVWPPTATQSAITAVLEALDAKITIHDQISRTTAALRDTLLPVLFASSGPVPIPGIQHRA